MKTPPKNPNVDVLDSIDKAVIPVLDTFAPYHRDDDLSDELKKFIDIVQIVFRAGVLHAGSQVFGWLEQVRTSEINATQLQNRIVEFQAALHIYEERIDERETSEATPEGSATGDGGSSGPPIH